MGKISADEALTIADYQSWIFENHRKTIDHDGWLVKKHSMVMVYLQQNHWKTIERNDAPCEKYYHRIVSKIWPSFQSTAIIVFTAQGFSDLESCWWLIGAKRGRRKGNNNDNEGRGERGGYRRTPTQDTDRPLLHIIFLLNTHFYAAPTQLQECLEYLWPMITIHPFHPTKPL